MGSSPSKASRRRYLTKSRFKVGVECPTKLYYLDRKLEYGNTMADDEFLAALARGGFQVGELAKLQYPGGILIDTLDADEAVRRTEDMLEQNDEIILYEAAIRHGDCLVRVDVLRKIAPDRFELLEVKSKSIDPSDGNGIYTAAAMKQGTHEVSSAWKPYVLDVAFQKHVLMRRFPKAKVKASLVLTNKSALASVDGLNQKFRVLPDRSVRVASGTTPATIGASLLIEIPVDQPIQQLWLEPYPGGRSFDQFVDHLAALVVTGKKATPEVSRSCAGCEFRIPSALREEGLKSGFEECWTEAKGLTAMDLEKPWTFDIWKLHWQKRETLLDQGKPFMEDLIPSDLEATSPEDPDGPFEIKERQWIQVHAERTQIKKPIIALDALANELESWRFPLHFIDFETNRVAIPFHKGERPFGQIAFQFSHHMLTRDGKIEHRHEYLQSKPGVFPNFEFVRALKKALEGDEGTILRYATHENTVLTDIHEQLEASNEPDRRDLMQWIETITQSKNGSERQWTGDRNMIDMCELVRRYYYSFHMHGSASIKKVLPAILKESPLLRQKYSMPIYGTPQMPSRNFKETAWVKFAQDGSVLDPYKSLPPLFSDPEVGEKLEFLTDDELRDGGAAMTAWGLLQFQEMPDAERRMIEAGLLRYCELDTLAMVMLWEHWKECIEQRISAPRPSLPAGSKKPVGAKAHAKRAKKKQAA